MHRFYIPKSESEARAIQEELRREIRLFDDFDKIETIAGVDVGYDIENGLAHASIVTMSIDDLKPIEAVEASVPVDFPYIPGLLAFREIPAVLDALDGLITRPDLFMVDGQGIAHPRRLGIAAHLGVLLNKPAIGVAKSRLTGRYDMPGIHKGEQSALMAGGEQIGVVLRSKDEVNPLFVSPGHRLSMKTAVDITLRCLTRFKLPEPTRLADKLSKVRPVKQMTLLSA
ncbi:deoxyribonuclease V [Asticcacaulis sp. SL142]|uniref:deoxyribonuclease V n=1 Tax=Asticcacaulis sp. SL142 TaxID=2995155 RepID=UPI00226C7B94|nr:deoxyribonuclease V [Asticcacaulis sp. SL142]WAC48862.1 deoxyribonuclease V [Asticcacaulis sp. SL142]